MLPKTGVIREPIMVETGFPIALGDLRALKLHISSATARAKSMMPNGSLVALKKLPPIG